MSEKEGLANPSNINLQPICQITDLPQQQPLPLEIQSCFWEEGMVSQAMQI